MRAQLVLVLLQEVEIVSLAVDGSRSNSTVVSFFQGPLNQQVYHQQNFLWNDEDSMLEQASLQINKVW
jgi:hypothetical protein